MSLLQTPTIICITQLTLLLPVISLFPSRFHNANTGEVGPRTASAAGAVATLL